MRKTEFVVPRSDKGNVSGEVDDGDPGLGGDEVIEQVVAPIHFLPLSVTDTDCVGE